MLNKNISVEVVTFDIISSIFISVGVRAFSPVYRTIITPLSFRGSPRKSNTAWSSNPTARAMPQQFNDERDAWMKLRRRAMDRKAGMSGVLLASLSGEVLSPLNRAMTFQIDAQEIH
jgi:hypothetical protein